MPTPSQLTTKLKISLKLAVSRLRMVQQKETALAKQARRSMAHLLEQGREESARIRVENIIRQDISVELMEILELYCELLLARIGLMEAKECDPGLEEAVKSIIYAAPRTEVKELHNVRDLLVSKYGKEFALKALENSDGKISERVLKKLRVEPPDATLVTMYLKEIARTYGIAWNVTPPSTPPPGGEDDDEPSTKQRAVPLLSDESDPKAAELSQAIPPRKIALKSPIRMAPPSPTTDNVHPTIKFPEPPALKPSSKTTEGMGGVNGLTGRNAETSRKATSGQQPNIPDAEDLAKRFAALKKR